MFTKVAGSTYSCVAAPIQFAAITGYSQNDSIDEYMKDCRNIISLIGEKTVSLLSSIPQVNCSTPWESLLLPENDFSVRCSFIDFDGFKAYNSWKKINQLHQMRKIHLF